MDWAGPSTKRTPRVSNPLMYTQMALQAVHGFAQYSTARSDAAFAETMQKYHNNIKALGAARQLNAQTVNDIGVQDAAIRDQLAIKAQAIRDQAAAEVAAAAAGVTGNSVKTQAHSLRGSAAMALHNVDRNTANTRSQIEADSQSIRIAAITGKNRSVIPKPSPFSMLLGLGGQALATYSQYNE